MATYGSAGFAYLCKLGELSGFPAMFSPSAKQVILSFHNIFNSEKSEVRDLNSNPEPLTRDRDVNQWGINAAIDLCMDSIKFI